MKKKFWLIIPVIAAFFVFLGTGQAHFYPMNQSLTLNDENVSSFVDTEKGFVAIRDQRLIFATPKGEVIKAIKPTFEGDDCDLREVLTDGESIYVILGTYEDKYSYYSSERVEKYSFSGKYLGEIIKRTYQEDDLVANNYFTDVAVKDGTAYITDARYYITNLLAVPSDPGGTPTEWESVASVNTGEFILWGRYDTEQKRMLLFNRFGETYIYELETHDITYHPELVEPKQVKAPERTELSLPFAKKALDLLYYVGSVILIISLLIGLILLIRTGVLRQYRTPIVFLMFFVVAVFFYTNQSLEDYDATVKERVTAAATSVNQSFSFFLSTIFDESGYDDIETFKDDVYRDWIDWANEYLDAACDNSGKEMGMYAQIYMFDKEGEPRLLVDTYDEFTIGNPYVAGNYHFDAGDIEAYVGKYIIETSIDGSYSYINYPVYDFDENVIGFFQMGSRYDRIRSYQISKVVDSFLQLLAFVMFLYILLDVTQKYNGEIKEFFQKRKTDPAYARICLSNTYDFLVSGLMYLDSLLLIKAIASIYTSTNMELALAFAIPLTAYRIGSWIGSVTTSALLGHFGERKMGVFSAIISTLTFVGMVVAILQKNIYILAGCKFVEGIFLESILFSLSEGIPYEIEDEEFRNKKILESQSATQAAIMIALMVGGIIAEYAGYAILYIFGAVICATLIPLSYVILGGCGEEEESNIKTGKVWKAFARPKALLYILLVVMVVSFLYGYEEYIFPLFSENSGLSSMVLSSIGVLVNAASYFGEGVTTLFKKYTPLKAMVRAFTVAGAAVLLLILNQSVVFAVMVYFTISILFRVIDSKKIVQLIELCKSDELEAKDIQENYYALEDGFKMLQSPVLGTLSAITISLSMGFLGLLSVAAPRLYYFINSRSKSGSKE